MTVDQLRDQMRQRFTAISSREWCSVKGVNHAHVSEFLSGKRGPGSDLLAALNLRVDYVRIRGRRALTTPPTPDRIGKDAVREAARALVAKLDECDQHIADAFVHREMRCGPYEGPNYSAELRNLRRALSATTAQEVDETERLREALRKIADDPYQHGQRIQKMKAIARAALQHKGEVSRG